MPAKTLEQLRLYNNWANEIIFRTFEKYGERIPSSSQRLLSHLVNVQLVWISRITREKAAVAIWDLQNLEDCKKMHQDASAAIKAILENYADETHTPIEYVNLQGTPFRNSLFDILFQIFNHGTYHRAQIALDMRQNGLEPVNTDYVTFIRS